MTSDSPATGATVASSLLRHLVDMARAGGLPIMPLLALAGISREQLSGPDQRLPLRALERLVGAAVELSGDSLLGLHLAQRSAEAAVAPAAGLSLQQTLALAMGRLGVLAEQGTVSLLPQGEGVLWCWQGRGGHGECQRQMAEYLLAFAHIAYLRPWRPLPVLALYLQQPAPVDPEQARAYERLFACPVLYEQAGYGLLLRASLLEQPFNASTDEVGAPLPAAAPNPVIEGARAQLRVLLGRGLASRERLAEEMGLSARQLHRQLEGAGSSYRQLLDELRLEQARALLADPKLSLELIAERLHFSESQSFSRWFRALTAITPAEYRRQQARVC